VTDVRHHKRLVRSAAKKRTRRQLRSGKRNIGACSLTGTRRRDVGIAGGNCLKGGRQWGKEKQFVGTSVSQAEGGSVVIQILWGNCKKKKKEGIMENIHWQKAAGCRRVGGSEYKGIAGKGIVKARES